MNSGLSSKKMSSCKWPISQLTFRISNTYTSPLTIHRRVHKRCSLKRKGNWRKLLLLGFQTGDKLAKPPFFVAYSQLCRPCRNLAEGDCLLVTISFYALSLLFGSCYLLELTLAGPQWTYTQETSIIVLFVPKNIPTPPWLCEFTFTLSCPPHWAHVQEPIFD